MTNKEILQEYNTRLNENNLQLASILHTINNMEGGGTDGGAGDEENTVGVSVSNLNDTLRSTINTFNDNLLQMPNNYDVYTTDPVTLCSPNAEYNWYLIRKRSYGYGIIWFRKQKTSTLYYYNSSTTYSGTVLLNEYRYLYNAIVDEDQNKYAFMTGIPDTVYISTQNYSSLSDAIAAIQDPATTYSTSNNCSWGSVADDNYDIGPTNMPYLNNVLEIGKCRRISKDETIQVVSTE